jgi:uncharacterized protein YggT (Ycf19 family)
MGLLDFLLNLAALLLWLNWRAIRFDPLAKTSAASLVGTLKRAEPRPSRGWPFPAGLAVLLLLRAFVYWQIGTEVNWTPQLDLTIVSLAFRNDPLHFVPVLLYSWLSFGRTLLVCYFWLLALALINRGSLEPDPFQRMLRLYLGRVTRWPWPVQALLPLLVVAGVWTALHPLLVRCAIASPVRDLVHLLEQGLLLGVGLYLSLKYLLPVFLLLHLVASYVYLGNNSFWAFVNATSSNLLAPLRRLPLRVARIDLAPVAGAVLVLFLLHVVPDYLLPRILQRNLALFLWPQ